LINIGFAYHKATKKKKWAIPVPILSLWVIWKVTVIGLPVSWPDTPRRRMRILRFWFPDPEIRVWSSGNCTRRIEMDNTDMLTVHWPDITTSSVTCPCLRRIVSWSHPHGIRLWDYGIWGQERPLDYSPVTIKKFTLLPSHPITVRSSLPVPTVRSSYGTLLLIASSPLRPTTITIGFHVWDILPFWRTPPSNNPSLLTSPPSDGMVVWRSGPPTSKSDKVSRPMNLTSIPWAFHLMVSSSLPVVRIRNSTFGISMTWPTVLVNSMPVQPSTKSPSTPSSNGLPSVPKTLSRFTTWWALPTSLSTNWRLTPREIPREVERRFLNALPLPGMLWVRSSSPVSAMVSSVSGTLRPKTNSDRKSSSTYIDYNNNYLKK